MQPAYKAQTTSLSALALGAIGVVYGDIGTSPLYTLKQVFMANPGIAIERTNILGTLSLIFWSLIIVVSLKYVLFVMRADNRGEGGVMALMALALRQVKDKRHVYELLMLLGLFGAALFYGDGIITPAISVLSAIEGLKIAAPSLQPWVIPLTILVLFLLFFFQRSGSARVGKLFGPIMILWFVTIGWLGLKAIMQTPAILAAFNPYYALNFFIKNKSLSFIALGCIVLALTGAEALYADIGHFGRRPIQRAWFILVLPALLLNYFGQGALLLQSPAAIQNPFYLLAPSWLLYPLIILATLATVIASQAVISGAFSITHQAIKLGYLPRLEVQHTSEREIGQIYLPAVNWGLLAAVIIVVLGFQSSDNLASAYGVAVTGTMLITTLLVFIVIHYQWHWRWWQAALIFGFFLIIDIAFFSANMLKISSGGWLPLMIAVLLFTVMITWKQGIRIFAITTHNDSIPLLSFIHNIMQSPPTRVSGTAVFMTTDPYRVPRALLHNLMHNKVLHERIIVLTVEIEDVPHISPIERIEVRTLHEDFFLLLVRYGFKDDPNIPHALPLCGPKGLDIHMMETSFFLGRETLVPTLHPQMARWREKLFLTMFRNASSATTFFKIPSNRVVELGTQVEL